MKVEVLLEAGVDQVYEQIAVMERRLQWDSLVLRAHVQKVIDEHNSLVYLAMRPVAFGQRAHDYALLQSTRKDSEDGYIVASRSVRTTEIPPAPGLNRGAVLPSGFLLEAVESIASLNAPSKKNGMATKLTYALQMPPLKGITGNFVRVSVSIPPLFLLLPCLAFLAPSLE